MQQSAANCRLTWQNVFLIWCACSCCIKKHENTANRQLYGNYSKNSRTPLKNSRSPRVGPRVLHGSVYIVLELLI